MKFHCNVNYDINSTDLPNRVLTLLQALLFLVEFTPEFILLSKILPSFTLFIRKRYSPQLPHDFHSQPFFAPVPFVILCKAMVPDIIQFEKQNHPMRSFRFVVHSSQSCHGM